MLSRLAAIAICFIAVIFCPRQCVCENKLIDNLAKDILTAVKWGNAEELQNKFDELGAVLKTSENQTEDANKFLELFITDMNNQHGTNLTLQDAWQIANENLRYSSLSRSAKASGLRAVEIFESVKNFYTSGWFGPDIYSMGYDSKTLDEVMENMSKSRNVDGLPGQLHPGTIIGGLEMIVGGAVILCLGETVVGGVIGGGLIADGLRRIADDGQTDFESSLRNRNPAHRSIR